MGMIITPYNLVQGPADLYAAPFGSAEPADSAATVAAGAPGGAFVGVGATDADVTMEIDVTVDDLMVDQVIDPVGGRVTARQISLKTQLREVTLSNMSLAVNGMVTTTVSASYSVQEPTIASDATQPVYTALIFDTWAPTLASGAPARRRIIVRKVLSKPKVQLVSGKGKNALYDCTWTAYWISPTVKLYHQVDQTA
ncbi:MAG: hypothetical protein YHS30scaffold324_67 [Catenulispora phage 69_17]|jgi:hypothetical protein|nr:MAG: hypothetical protein YHS30scaffold324_67 [Catenulispora phage 69_17]